MKRSTMRQLAPFDDYHEHSEAMHIHQGLTTVAKFPRGVTSPKNDARITKRLVRPEGEVAALTTSG